MIGAIAGDVIGSVYEAHPIKTKRFPLFDERSRFTDDTVLTIAIAEAILNDGSYAETLKAYTRRYPDAGFGGHFWRWAHSAKTVPYGSWGNGSAMRVSPIGHAFETDDEVLAQAQRSAEVTHNHPEGIKGAQATALAVHLARRGRAKDELRMELQERFGYDLNRTVEAIRPSYRFDVSCQGSVPEALISFFDSINFVDAVRNAVSLGGDSDTLACIAGAVAEAFYGGVPPAIEKQARNRLPPEFLAVIDAFDEHCGI